MDYQMMENLQRMNSIFDLLYSIAPIALYGGILLVVVSVILLVSKNKKLCTIVGILGLFLTIAGIVINNFLSNVRFGG